jgi:hypothetical protein
MRSKFSSTIICAVLGVCAIAVWAGTFEPHGGLNLSKVLFPLSNFALSAIFKDSDIPVPLWYVSAFLQYLVLGLLIDLVRYFVTFRNGKA